MMKILLAASRENVNDVVFHVAELPKRFEKHITEVAPGFVSFGDKLPLYNFERDCIVMKKGNKRVRENFGFSVNGLVGAVACTYTFEEGYHLELSLDNAKSITARFVEAQLAGCIEKAGSLEDLKAAHARYQEKFGRKK